MLDQKSHLSFPLYLKHLYLQFLFGLINWFPFEYNWRNLGMPVQDCSVQTQFVKLSLFIYWWNFCEIRKAMVANTLE